MSLLHLFSLKDVKFGTATRRRKIYSNLLLGILVLFWYQPNLNKFLALGRPAWKEARTTLQKLLSCKLLMLFNICSWFVGHDFSYFMYTFFSCCIRQRNAALVQIEISPDLQSRIYHFFFFCVIARGACTKKYVF